MAWNGSDQGKAKEKVERKGRDQEGGGKCHHSTRDTQRSSLKHGIIGGLVVVFGCAGVWWFVGRGGDNQLPTTNKLTTTRTIAEVEPQIPTSRVDLATHGEMPLPMPTLSNKRIETRPDIPAPRPLEELSKGLALANTNKPPRKAAFANAAEQLIAMATPAYPGAPVPPLPMITDESLAKSLKTAQSHVIMAEDGDSEQLLEKKLLVAEAKEEFAALKESHGFTFVDYVTALREKANDDHDFLVDAHKVVDMIYHDETISDEDYKKYRDEVNASLLERGLPPLDAEEDDADDLDNQNNWEKQKTE